MLDPHPLCRHIFELRDGRLCRRLWHDRSRSAVRRERSTDSRVLERSALTSQATELSGANCDIKGNISVNTGERYFCSEAEARAAGWRRSA